MDEAALLPRPPPKDQEAADYGDPANGGYMNDLSGGNGMMPPRAPFGPPGPGAVMPKSRPNYTKLGEIVYPTELPWGKTANISVI